VPKVVRFNVTPVKSTALHHPDEIRLERGGPVGDRAFFFVDENGRRFSGATKAPILPIRASYDPDRELLELTLPNGIAVAGSTVAEGRAIVADFYGRPVAARIVEGNFSEALSDYIGRDIFLARPDRPGEALDVRPVTLVSQESVDELARQGGHDGELSPARFRMTIEIAGVPGPHEEDTWRSRRVRAGEALLLIEGAVPRCTVTTLDPATGIRDFPTLHVIKDYRGVSAQGDLEFGVYAEVIEPGTVRVGDGVEVL
jgi:MOSC domain-containing protein